MLTKENLDQIREAVAEYMSMIVWEDGPNAYSEHDLEQTEYIVCAELVERALDQIDPNLPSDVRQRQIDNYTMDIELAGL